MSQISRRSFIKASALAGAGFAAPALWFQPELCAQTPNERFTIGYVGCGGVAHHDIREIGHFGDVVAFADVDDRHSNEFKNNTYFCSKPDSAITTRDYRKLLDRNDIEVIGISVPDHWHVKIAIDALAAGKHVFCQKPLTLTIEESQLIRKAVAKYGKTFQVGTQQRADRPLFLTAAAMIRKGLLGDIKKVVVGIDGSDRSGAFQVQPVPEYFDWNQWLGQAPYTDYIPERTHERFRWWYEYSGGKFTDWGAHHVDIAHWALKEDQLGCGPIWVDGTDATHNCEFDENGYPKRSDMFNTAVDFNIKFKFASGVDMEVTSRTDNGIIFEGTQGRIFVNRGRLVGKPIEDGVHKQVTQEDLIAMYHGKPVEDRMSNFFRCIKEGGMTLCDPVSHTVALTTCHLCGIAARLKTSFKWDPKTETSPDCDKANGFIHRDQRKGFELPTV